MLYNLYETDRRRKREIERKIRDYGSLNLSYLDNLNKKFTFRPYQKESFARLEYEFEEWKEYGEDKPLHLFFNLATGSGKTLIMAENILYLYEQGYRNFIFFVHQNPILNKTKENFLNKNSNKYLFEDEIIFNSKKIKIKEVDSFSNVNADDINIIFTTCAGLHDYVISPRENRMSLPSLKNTKIVLLADEAHHLLADTKDGITELERSSWEDTVKRKLLCLNSENILLEYSATIDLNNSNILEEYKDKVLIKYGLKEFREEGYSKDIYLFKSGDNKNIRILRALVMSFYRQSVAEYYSSRTSEQQIFFANSFKPVVFVKSSNVESSTKDLNDFIAFLPQITKKEIELVLNSDDERINKVRLWFKEIKHYTNEDLAEKIKQEFGYNFNETIRQINSKLRDNDDKKSEFLTELNNLDSKNNKIRIIFAVNMLTEGWDVLCLYDVVRLDEGDKKVKDSVVSDIQLIGRGCRYNPFYIDTDIENKYKRKFDNTMEHNLRCLEEFYYHSKNDSKYISTLKEGLVKEGLKNDTENDKLYACSIKLKTIEKHPQTVARWQNRLVYYNDLINVEDNEKLSIFDYSVEKQYEVTINSKTEFSVINLYSTTNDNRLQMKTEQIKIDRTILRKAIDSNSFFTFKNLITYLPKMKTKEELIDLIEKEFIINATFFDKEHITRKELLNIYSNILKKVEKTIKNNNYKQKGSKKFKSKYLKDVLGSYTRYTTRNSLDNNADGKSIYEADDSIFVDVDKKDWYVYEDCFDDSLEKKLIRHISDAIDNNTYPFDKCQNLLLVRNNGICKLYDFNSDRGFEPDFLLYFTREQENLNYMLFVEPKGEHLKGDDNDKWKENFMLEIENNAIIENNSGVNKYKVIGLKFFTEENNQFPQSLQSVFEKNNIT